MAISTGAAILGSAGIGALAGGKGQKGTQSTAPVLPENVKKAYDTLINRSSELSAQPYQDVVRTRYEPSTAYGGLFNNPEMAAIQQDSDRKLFAKMFESPEQQQMPQQNQQTDMINEMYVNQMLGQIPEFSRFFDAARRSGRLTPESYSKITGMFRDGGLQISPGGLHGSLYDRRGAPAGRQGQDILSILRGGA